jgi:hypothetical protein
LAIAAEFCGSALAALLENGFMRHMGCNVGDKRKGIGPSSIDQDERFAMKLRASALAGGMTPEIHRPIEVIWDFARLGLRR